MKISNSVLVTTNSSFQTISNFDLGWEKSVRYQITSRSKLDVQTAIVDITHNGVDVSDVQYTYDIQTDTPLEYTATISNNVGRLSVTPQANSTTLHISKSSVDCSVYGEATLSGRKIYGQTGVGYFANSSVDRMTIRYPNNNYFGNSSPYLNAGTLGPVVYGNEILTENWIGHNGATFNDHKYTSSGQDDNSIYQQVTLIPGAMYRLQVTASPTVDGVNSLPSTLPHADYPSIFVGQAIGKPNEVDTQIVSNSTYTVDFIATNATSYVGIGRSSLGYMVDVSAASLKRVGPVVGFDNNQGTLMVKWNSVANSTNVVEMNYGPTQHTVSISLSNRVLWDGIDCGNQSTNNTLVLISTNTSIVILNGSNTTIAYDTFRCQNIKLNSSVTEFSYTPEIVSGEQLIDLING